MSGKIYVNILPIFIAVMFLASCSTIDSQEGSSKTKYEKLDESEKDKFMKLFLKEWCKVHEQIFNDNGMRKCWKVSGVHFYREIGTNKIIGYRLIGFVGGFYVVFDADNPPVVRETYFTHYELEKHYKTFDELIEAYDNSNKK